MTFSQDAACATYGVTAQPPRVVGAITPPPIVIGEGNLAVETVKAICLGWGYPGDPVEIDCVSPDPGWIQVADAAVGSWALLTFTRAPWLEPTVVVRQISAIDRLWQQPPSRYGTLAGRTVYIAVEDEALAQRLAEALSRSFPSFRVSQIVSSSENTVASTLSAVIAAETDWEVSDPGTNNELLSALRDPHKLSLLENCISDVLAAGNVFLGNGPLFAEDPLLLTPEELKAISQQVLDVLGIAGSPATELTGLEFAFRLPQLAARAGLQPHRASSYIPLLDTSTLDRLAPLVHHSYQEIALAHNNATGSPLSGTAWAALSPFEKSANRQVIAGSAIAFAALGFGWRTASSPRSLDLSAVADQLGELEHRRWARHQRANGRDAHVWMQPWNDIPADVKRYDIELMTTIPEILKHAGIEVFSL